MKIKIQKIFLLFLLCTLINSSLLAQTDLEAQLQKVENLYDSFYRNYDVQYLKEMVALFEKLTEDFSDNATVF